MNQITDVQDLKLNQQPRDKDRLLQINFTHVRPYISDNGAINNGPKATARKDVENVIAKIVEFVISGNEISYESHMVRQ
jgi:hypothetical protein